MNSFITTFDKDIRFFWDYSEPQKQQVLTNILQYATNHSEQFIEEVNPMLFDEELGISPIL